MSYIPPPPPVHPKTSTTQTRPLYRMAATQLPPLGPHTFLPSPPIGRHHEGLHTVPVPQFPRPPPPTVFRRFYEGIPLPKVISPRAPNTVSTSQSPPKKRQSAVPVESLLQSEPYSPSYSRAATSPKGSAQISPRTVIGPSTPHTGPLVDSLPFRHELSEGRGKRSFRDEYRHAQLPSPPSHRSHRDTATSCYSSGTSSSDYRPGSAILSQPTSSLPVAPVQPHVPSRYRLSIRQQPIAARACGFGERDRRVVDPPPILKLTLADYDPSSPTDVAELRWPLNIVHCALYSVPHSPTGNAASVDVTSIPDPNNPAKFSRRLMGTLVASPFIGNDPDAPESETKNARLGCFFVFHDLSCRQNGLYKLRFTLMHVNVELAFTGSRGKILSSIESDVFEVFSAKDFPGMKPSTALTIDLKRQGANIQVKKGKKRPGNESEESGSNDSDEDGGKKKQGKRKKKKRRNDDE